MIVYSYPLYLFKIILQRNPQQKTLRFLLVLLFSQSFVYSFYAMVSFLRLSFWVQLF
ncbi:hypothetical protein LEP1GSC168_0040 [Leptospira santarosai str. HAI134]|nr:hypothetical protein LEP1GSC168_0040 [Leptospira santarosai str. HAI134]